MRDVHRHARRLEGQAVDAETRLNALREQVTARAYTRDRIAATVGLTLWAGRLGDLARLVGSYERAATAAAGSLGRTNSKVFMEIALVRGHGFLRTCWIAATMPA